MLHPLLIATPIKFRFKFGYEVIFHCSSGCLVIRIHFVEGHDIEFMPARHTGVQVTAHAQPNIFSCVVPVKPFLGHIIETINQGSAGIC